MLLLLLRKKWPSSYARNSIYSNPVLDLHYRFLHTSFALEKIYITKAVSPDHQNPQPSIYIDKCSILLHNCTPIRSTCILRFSRSGFFWFSRCPSHTWAHIKYPSSLCVCTRVYQHTHTHHPNTRKNRKIYKTKPLSLTLPKHSLPGQ